MTHVSIIGTGNMGSVLAGLVTKGGNTVETFNTSDVDKPVSGDVVILAVYYPAVREVLAQRGEQLAGKVVVDITNPVDTQTWDKLATPPGASSAEEAQQLVPQGTPVVKAFNTTFAPTLVEGQVAGQPLDVFLAGDDEEAKETVAQLARRGPTSHRRRRVEAGEAAGGPWTPGNRVAAAAGVELPERLEAHKLGDTRIPTGPTR